MFVNKRIGIERWAFGYLAACLLVVVGAALFREYPFVNHDVAFNLVTGRQIVSGVPFYVDWMDNNPPSIYLISAMVSWLAGANAHLEIMLYSALFLGCAGLGIQGCSRSLRQEGREDLRAVVLWAQLFVALSASISISEFGQREALFFLLFLPHLVNRIWLEDAQESWRFRLLLLGFLAAMKPQFVLLLGWVEICGAVINRQVPWRAWLVFMAGGLLPIGILFVLNPASAAEFFTVIVPFHFSDGAKVYDASWSEVPHRIGWVSIALIVSGVLALFYAIWARVFGEKERWLLGGVLVGSILVVAQQGRLYAYHFILPAGMAALVLALVMARAWKNQAGAHRLLGGFALGILVLNFLSLVRIEWLQSPPVETAMNEELDGHERVLFVSTSVLHVYGYFYSGIVPVGPWAVHFVLPALQKEPDLAVRAWRLREYGEFMRPHLEKAQPTAVVFSANNQALAPFRSHTFPATYTLLADHLPLDGYSGRFVDLAGTWVIMEWE